jgi:hypothetical protein
MERRDFLRTTLGAAAALSGATLIGAPAARALRAQARPAPGAQAALPTMTTYKSPTCGCCTGWVDHAKAAGFTVKVIDTADLASVKREMGVPARLQSCHTVMVGGYVVEGHVPAADVKRLLAQKPKVRGLAVPGMPIGSPGMEQGPPSGYDRYDVLTFDDAGKTTVFATHGPPRRG